jgi:uncharacterized protein involved in type VI secretion and phage assembly
MSGPFYGKYFGIVTDTDDPERRGRIRAHVPDVSKVTGVDECGWARPCVPFAGAGMGFFAVPAVDASVWIEFERGDSEFPIWTGCLWGTAAEMPSILAASESPPEKVLLQTRGGAIVILDDSPGGGITLQTATGQKIVMSADGIEIDNGKQAKVSLKGSTVHINDDALEVT